MLLKTAYFFVAMLAAGNSVAHACSCTESPDSVKENVLTTIRGWQKANGSGRPVLDLPLVAVGTVKTVTYVGSGAQAEYGWASIEIVQVILGQETRNEITVWGAYSPGDCRRYIELFKVGQSHLLWLRPITQKGYPPESIGDYVIHGVCSGPTVLEFNSETRSVSGPIKSKSPTSLSLSSALDYIQGLVKSSDPMPPWLP
jgi:hypothetical protein